jgi:hypothetical protein
MCLCDPDWSCLSCELGFWSVRLASLLGPMQCRLPRLSSSYHKFSHTVGTVGSVHVLHCHLILDHGS